MAHFYSINKNRLDDINLLFKNKVNNQYTILNTYGAYCDIAQYSSKYDNVKVICVKSDNLDTENCL